MGEAFILETVVSTGTRRGGETFWTLDSAVEAARKVVKRKLARCVRVLRVGIDDTPAAIIGETEGVKHGS